MFLSPDHILSILEHYHYWLIFPIAIFEGPIIIIISGFLVYLGVLNVFVAWAMLVVADSIGDSLYYLLGKYWTRLRWIKKLAGFLGYDEKSEKFLESHFRKHKVKTFLLAKFSHGVGSSVQIASGMAKVKYSEFLPLNIIGTMPKALILITVGFYAGQSYVKIDNYLDGIALFTFSIAIAVLLWVIIRKYIKNYFAKKD